MSIFFMVSLLIILHELWAYEEGITLALVLITFSDLIQRAIFLASKILCTFEIEVFIVRRLLNNIIFKCFFSNNNILKLLSQIFIVNIH